MLILIPIWKFQKKLRFMFFLYIVSTFLPLGYLYDYMLQKTLKMIVVHKYIIVQKNKNKGKNYSLDPHSF